MALRTFLFGVIQCGLTTAVASGVASLALLASGGFLVNWARSWVEAWALMVPIVIFAAPFIRRASLFLTRAET